MIVLEVMLLVPHCWTMAQCGPRSDVTEWGV